MIPAKFKKFVNPYTGYFEGSLEGKTVDQLFWHEENKTFIKTLVAAYLQRAIEIRLTGEKAYLRERTYASLAPKTDSLVDLWIKNRFSHAGPTSETFFKREDDEPATDNVRVVLEHRNSKTFLDILVWIIEGADSFDRKLESTDWTGKDDSYVLYRTKHSSYVHGYRPEDHMFNTPTHNPVSWTPPKNNVMMKYDPWHKQPTRIFAETRTYQTPEREVKKGRSTYWDLYPH